jgi:pre-mRNA-splicing helicase BRR2
MENWYLVVGDHATKSLLVIKRVTVQKTITRTLDFNMIKGVHNLKLYLISDSYMGADQEFDFTVNVAEGEDSDDSDEEMDG